MTKIYKILEFSRSNRSQVFYKIIFWKISENLDESTCAIAFF